MSLATRCLNYGMRNSPTASPLVETSYAAYAAWYDSLSIAERRAVDLASLQEEETISRQIGMNEIDNQEDCPEIDFSDEDVADLTSEDRDYASEDIRPSFTERNNEWERKRNRPPRHILRKGNNADNDR